MHPKTWKHGGGSADDDGDNSDEDDGPHDDDKGDDADNDHCGSDDNDGNNNESNEDEGNDWFRHIHKCCSRKNTITRVLEKWAKCTAT